MKAITFHGVRELAFEEVPEPAILEPGDAIVDVSVAGICGSDLHPYFGRETGLDRGTVMGHELVGRVTEVGTAVRNLEVGARVVIPFTTSCASCWYCRSGLTARCERGQLFGWVEEGVGLHGTQADRVRVPMADTTLVRVPEAIEDDAVALLAGDVLSTARFGAEMARVGEGDAVAVVGCGPVGLLAVRAALERGAGSVAAVDRVPSRLLLAERFGAIPVHLDADDAAGIVHERTEGRGADAVIEAVGSPAATRLAATLARPGAVLAAVGVHTEPHLAISPGDLYDRNLTYAAGRCPARHYLPGSLELAARDEELLRELITHRLPLADGVDAYRTFAAREDGCVKIILEVSSG